MPPQADEETTLAAANSLPESLDINWDEVQTEERDGKTVYKFISHQDTYRHLVAMCNKKEVWKNFLDDDASAKAQTLFSHLQELSAGEPATNTETLRKTVDDLRTLRSGANSLSYNIAWSLYDASEYLKDGEVTLDDPDEARSDRVQKMLWHAWRKGRGLNFRR